MTFPLAAAPATHGKTQLSLDLASRALRSGNLAEAETVLRDRLAEVPEDVNCLYNLGTLAELRGNPSDALVYLSRAVAAAPRNDIVRLRLARMLQQMERVAESLSHIEALSSAARDSFDVRAMEAALLGILGRHERELALYELLVEQAPANAALWKSYGDALKTVGRTSDAIDALRKAIRLNRNYGEAYWTLGNFKRTEFSPRDVAAMRKALKANIGGNDRICLHFALGEALEQRGDAEGAFGQYDSGNRLRASMLTPAQMSIGARVDAAISTFSRELFDRFEGSGHPAAGPIFIVGLQRSGSTLLEQILASHPQIEGTSELLQMERIWQRVAWAGGGSGNPFVELPKLDPAALADLGKEYLAGVATFRQAGLPWFIDKLPANWLNVGLIRLILPNARIVDARRHPMACGFSNFKQHYATGVNYAYSQESIGRFYTDYLRLMRHFDAVQPGKIHRVVNERLIDDPEGEVRRLIDFIGVPFDPACLAFHENRRAVRTPSAEQVRRPINRDGVDSWRKFEPWLGPMKQALGQALVDWE